ncbi:hypothetical protein E2C01_052102 [Portunus trituberculatus]|uniref:Uncharacterized protein n=1 Tax=Portunus trituberculatus TaxID=210409 RepID=A0A5B7GLG3_PORTR|nr:hypothetical protein [Portunus trituberculatus]
MVKAPSRSLTISPISSQDLSDMERRGGRIACIPLVLSCSSLAFLHYSFHLHPPHSLPPTAIPYLVPIPHPRLARDVRPSRARPSPGRRWMTSRLIYCVSERKIEQ